MKKKYYSETVYVVVFMFKQEFRLIWDSKGMEMPHIKQSNKNVVNHDLYL